MLARPGNALLQDNHPPLDVSYFVFEQTTAASDVQSNSVAGLAASRMKFEKGKIECEQLTLRARQAQVCHTAWARCCHFTLTAIGGEVRRTSFGWK